MTIAHEALLAVAKERDIADPLAEHVDRFLPAEGVAAYLDGNSLGRPLRVASDMLDSFVRSDWGGRLIRSWDVHWMELPLSFGDRIGEVLLGASSGQLVVADSTSIMLFKLMSAAVRMQPGRHEILIEVGNFPTDRFVAEAVADAHGLELRWIEADPTHGVTPGDVAAVVSDDTALLVLSHVDYRSGAVADMRTITEVAHAYGSLVLWDLCHSAGVVPVNLDTSGADFAVGCTYKYLNGGPGSPAFAFVRAELQDRIEQPIWGWMGASDVFGMGDHFEPATGMRRLLSGTPSVLGMVPTQGMVELVAEVGISQIREKSISLTELVIEAYDALLAPLGVGLRTPRDPERRGGHVTFEHGRFEQLLPDLWADGVLPDFREPSDLRVGLSPLSTTHVEATQGIFAIAKALAEA